MKPYRLLLCTVFVEGILASIWLFAEPSMQRNVYLFGFSLYRLALGALTLGLLAILASWVWMSFRDHPSLVKFDNQLDLTTDKPGVLLVIFTFLGLATITLLFLLLVMPRIGPFTSSFLSPDYDNLISTITAVISRIKPLLIWALLIIFQSAAFLFFRFQGRIRQPGFFSLQRVYYLALTALMLPVTLFHWAILFYQLYVFIAIPHWFWKFYDKPSINDWLFLPLSLAALFIASLVLWYPEKTRRNLVLLIVTGYLLQVGFGFIEDSGFERLRRNFIEKGHHGYVQYAARGIGLIELISNYEEVATTDPFFMTKPPGVISFYVLLDKLSFSLVDNPVQRTELFAKARFENLTILMSYLFPFLAVLVLIPLNALSKHLLGVKNANLPGLLFIFIPSFILTPLYLDQEFYPLIFILGILASSQVIQTNSIRWSIVAGTIAYLAIFFSFSLLPTIPLTLLWIGLDYVFNIQQRTLKSTIKQVLVFILIFFTIHMLFKLLLNYDFILRYHNALTQHRLHKEYLSGIQQVFDAAFLNNTEFAAWLGFPIAILFISALARLLFSRPIRSKESKDTLLISFIVTYIALSAFGQTRSEVARLWLFMVPIVCFFASSEALYLLSSLFSKKTAITAGFLYVILLQLGTTYLTFKFQDLD